MCKLDFEGVLASSVPLTVGAESQSRKRSARRTGSRRQNRRTVEIGVPWSSMSFLLFFALTTVAVEGIEPVAGDGTRAVTSFLRAPRKNKALVVAASEKVEYDRELEGESNVGRSDRDHHSSIDSPSWKFDITLFPPPNSCLGHHRISNKNPKRID